MVSALEVLGLSVFCKIKQFRGTFALGLFAALLQSRRQTWRSFGQNRLNLLLTRLFRSYVPLLPPKSVKELPQPANIGFLASHP